MSSRRGAQEATGERDGPDAGGSRRFLLVRVDDRLLHGQVVYGWGGRLAVRAYCIVDDRVADDPWEAQAYQGAPTGITVMVKRVAAFAAHWRELPDPEGTIVLLRDLSALHRLWADGFRPADSINIGGLREGAGAQRFLPNLQLTATGLRCLRELLRDGCPLHIQELPSSTRYDAAAIRELLTREGGSGE